MFSIPYISFFMNLSLEDAESWVERRS